MRRRKAALSLMRVLPVRGLCNLASETVLLLFLPSVVFRRGAKKRKKKDHPLMRENVNLTFCI